MTDPMKNEKEGGVRAAGKEVWVIKFGFADLINDLKPADSNPAAPVFISPPDLRPLLPAFVSFFKIKMTRLKQEQNRDS